MATLPKETITDAPEYYNKVYKGTPWHQWAVEHGAIGAKKKPEPRNIVPKVKKAPPPLDEWLSSVRGWE